MTNNTRWLDKEFLRWIAVLPGAVAVALLAPILVRWIVLANQYDVADRDENNKPTASLLALIPTEVLVQLAVAFFNPFIVILVGAYLAPRYRLRTAIVLAVLLAAVYYYYVGTFVANDIVDGAYDTGRWMRLALTVALWLGGVATGLFMARRLDRQQQVYQAEQQTARIRSG